MTVEEAKALLLCEGMTTEPVPEDALPITLHEGHFPAPERVSSLIEAIDIVHESFEDDTVIDRRIAGALWIIGVEANSAFMKDWPTEERDALISLVTAVESALVGFWPVGHPRDKDGMRKTPPSPNNGGTGKEGTDPI